ncbi:MAG TPA: heat-shock protein Hsp20 [candidate division Zixibacteria bacterium]|jgi:HSP20 family protein|nr:heat-shock protein Hsp20 [candidate division Zixibacteria bacterium]
MKQGPAIKARSLRHDFDRLLSDLRVNIHPLALLSDETVWHPYCDVYETKQDLVVKLELAGVNPAEISVSLRGRHLVIRGLRRDVGLGDDQRIYHTMEINQGAFERVVVVPETAAGSRAVSSYRDGILDIRLAKTAKGPVDVPIE